MITLDWEKKDFFKNMCQDMIALLKADALPIVVWGDTTEELFMPFFEKAGLIIDNLCDKRKVERKIGKDGRKKISIHPDEVDELYTNHNYNAVILVPYPKRIKDEINLFWHKPKRIFYLDIAKLHLHPKLFNKPDPKRFLKNKERLERVENFLEDEESKIVMQNMLNYWISGDHSLVKEYAERQSEQYLDILAFEKNEVFLNIGACDGRYTKRFINQVGEWYQAIYNLECDEINFERMKAELCDYKQCYFIKKGAWDVTGRLKFSADGNAGSYIGEEGKSEIEVDTVDNMFGNIPVSFIKADIEGAEYKMLIGAQNTIRKYKPKLAICCYHQMEDLIEIPLLIKEMNPDYKIKIRHYTDTLTETVCYAY